VKRIGRPSKLTPQTVKRILRSVGRGLPLVHAANAAGMSFQTLCTHRSKNPQFADALARAISKGIERRLRKIEDASNAGDWRASAWALEHCPGASEHFARNRIEVTGAGGAPLVGAVAIYLPQKDGSANGSAVVPLTARKEIGNGH